MMVMVSLFQSPIVLPNMATPPSPIALKLCTLFREKVCVLYIFHEKIKIVILSDFSALCGARH